MKTKTKSKKDFKAVDFMRAVRNRLSQEYLKDKKKYLKNLKDTMTAFKLQQLQANE